MYEQSHYAGGSHFFVRELVQVFLLPIARQ
jgi:hypothetical protein